MEERRYNTAKQAGLILCHDCSKLVPDDMQKSPRRQLCPRCGSEIHYRKSNSIGRTWALVITAMVMFFPANILPIMRVDFLGSVEKSTIMDGIIYFFEAGSYGIGLIILIASVLVPLFKIIGLIMILLSLQFNLKSWLRHKTAMFRFICFVGRWSMLDIFVIALLCVLVRFGALSSITAEPAVTYFSAVVVLTMLAANTFDSRLLWDSVSTAANEKQ